MIDTTVQIQFVCPVVL